MANEVTGYTARVASGDVTDLRTFALQCARATGANVTMRSDERDAPIHEQVVDPRYWNNVAFARERLQRAEAMTLDEAATLAQREHAEQLACCEAMRRENEKVQLRYEAMLEKVKAWRPPTPDHVKFKTFMIAQLELALGSDISSAIPSVRPQPASAIWYKASTIARARRDLEHCERALREATAQVERNNRWNQALVESLK